MDQTRPKLFKLLRLFSLLVVFFSACATQPDQSKDRDWSHYLGSTSADQYADLDQINASNVHQLTEAWSYRSGGADPKNRSQIQCNPLVIDGVLYGSSPTLSFFALNAATGEEMWTFDPWQGKAYSQFGMGVNRGLAFWSRGEDKRLLVTAGSFLYCVDAHTGSLIESFGELGKVDLHEGLGRDVSDLFIVSNSPGVIHRDYLILGARVSESTGAAPGHIRAFDVETGKIAWVFHTIPQPGEFGTDTWPRDAWKTFGGANAWAGFSIDPIREIVYVPTGSASFDFYGGDRLGENLFANCIIALDANTGERLWHFQTVHHDIWDRDLPCPGILVTLTVEGRSIDAIAQVTKSAQIFLLNRETGEPIFPIEEVPVMASTLDGEKAWATQPVPVKPPPFSRTEVTEKDLTRRTPEAYAYAKSIFDRVKSGPHFVPPSVEGSFIFPGLDGGGEWGGAAVDPSTGILYVNASEMPWILQMQRHENETSRSLKTLGRQVFKTHCQICHGEDLKGMAKDVVPSLLGLQDRLTDVQVQATISKGKGAMPAFTNLDSTQRQAVANFLLQKEDREIEVDERYFRSSWPYPYYFTGYNRFNDPEGFPAISPPWGTLNAVDLNKGTIKWKVVLGEFPELAAQGNDSTGCENYGGPVVTAGGLIFIAATRDAKIRAFDVEDGSLLWEADLPAAGFATPAVYQVDGKQYVVIACGGGKLGMPSGDQYVAFSL